MFSQINTFGLFMVPRVLKANLSSPGARLATYIQVQLDPDDGKSTSVSITIILATFNFSQSAISIFRRSGEPKRETE